MLRSKVNAMKKKSAFASAIDALAQRLGWRKPPATPPSTEYQEHVARKAADLLQKMQRSDLKTRFAELQDFLLQVQLCKVSLPSSELSGWTWYFVYENPERLDLQYSEICEAAIHLNTLMSYGSFEKLEAFYKISKSLNRST
jgi:hypothetical protein